MSHKIALISDIHIGVKNSDEEFLGIIKNFFKITLKNVLEVNNITDVRILGDLFHNRNSINIYALNVAYDIFDWYKENMPTVKFKVILGNHDIYFRNRTDINSVRCLSNYSNIELIDDITEEDINGKKIISYPWIVPGSSNDIHFQSHCNGKKKWDLCFGHFEIKGFKQNSNHICEHGLEKGIFKNYKKVYTGHYHTKSTMNNITYIGIPYECDWNDYGDTKGIHILNIDEETCTFIENTDSPKHVKIKVSEILEADSNFINGLKNHTIKVIVDKKYDEQDRIKAFNRIENANPLKIDTENEYIDDNIDTEGVDITNLGKPMSFLSDFIDNTDLPEGIEKTPLISRLSEMHESVAKENDE